MAIDTRMTALAVRRLTVRIGAELSGVQLREASDEQIAEVRSALLAHRVVFIRDQDLSAREQIDFARRLGPLTQGHPTLPIVDGQELILDLDSLAGGAANHWHTDVTFVDRPPMYSILRAMVIPEVGGDTLWANTVSGYADLPDDLRQLADQLRAVHSNGHDYARPDVVALRAKIGDVRLANLAAFASEVFETEHPVVRIHPETSEPALLLGGFAHRLVGHSSAESVDLIRIFQSYVTRPENVVRWHWRAGDVAIWDNRSTQHYAIYDYGDEHRRMQRVTTAGTPIAGLDGRPSVALQGDSTLYNLTDEG
ncbi:MAG TPA: TauD/TfdA family dioxygenase [Acidimicrobiales bacterium]|jgi:taurine dioxygenase|nr:TauD/TfdA family dioxygenase [Acidimicrobiales bacterium]